MPDAAEKVAEYVKLASPDDKLPAVCDWAQRLYEEGLTVAVRTASDGEARDLDDLLWTFSDRTFIPHAIAAEAEEPVLERVLIYAPGDQVGEADALIHAAGGEPDEALTRFARVVDFAEVHSNDAREAGRRRFAACRGAGYRMRFVE